MHTISETVTRKFINEVDLYNLEIETDNGWKPISKIMKTIPYWVWRIETDAGKTLECADDHIVFNENHNEVFVKNLKIGSIIQTCTGPDRITSVKMLGYEENMFDVTVDSDDHRYYTNGILSHNTSLANAISYALYGQALTNIKRENLINKINGKNMLVTLEFEKNEIKYRIERGRKPNILKLFVNNVQLKTDELEDDSQGDSRETQKSIEQILEMSHTMFKHLVALNTYTEPFLSMKAADQREVIEQLLGITLLSEKAELLKTQTKETKELIVNEQFRLEGIKSANDAVQKSINSLELKSSAWENKKDSDIEGMGRAILKLESVDIETELLMHNALAQWEDNNKKLLALIKQKSTLESALSQAEKTCNKYSSDIKKLADKSCPACEQELHDHKHTEMIATANEHLTESTAYLEKVEHDLLIVCELIQSIGEQPRQPQTFYESESEALGHKNNLHSLEVNLTNRADDVNPYQEQIAELKKTAIREINWDTVNTLSKLRDHQEFLHKLLTNKDSFIRKKIIDQNLTYLNKRLGYYIDKLGLPHRVVFLNDLTVEITQLGQDLDFFNLSRGEMNRVILATSFAFRDVWEGIYQSINLLFIDELLDNGTDALGVENSLGILKKMARERNKSVYLISHRDELIGRVNNVLRVVKSGGFTSYESTETVTESTKEITPESVV